MNTAPRMDETMPADELFGKDALARLDESDDQVFMLETVLRSMSIPQHLPLLEKR